MALGNVSDGTGYIYVAIGGTVLIWYLLARWSKYRRSWVHVPIVGDHGPIGSWKAALHYPYKAKEILQDGYNKHHDFAFQISTIRGWDVCICNETMVTEMQGLPDQIMSLNGFNEAFFQTQYTSPGFADSVPTVPVPVLAKALAWARQRDSSGTDLYFSGLVEELEYGLTMEISNGAPQAGGDVSHESIQWHRMSCFEFGSHLMLRLIAHVLFGSPLCRDPEAIDLFTRYGAAVPKSGQLISWLPGILKHWIAPRCAAPRMARQLDAIVLGMMKERQKLQLKEPQTIADYLCNWVQSEAAHDLGYLNVAQMLVSVIFGSVHSAGTVLASCLYELSTRPEYVEPLRQEAISALQAETGWTKKSIESLVKLDSFIKECHRHNPLTAASVHRLAKKDFTFRNGLKIPRGTFLYTPNSPLLFDERYYPQSKEFDGMRFYKLGQQSGNPDDYKLAGQLPKSRQFGAGRHACPGKQLAADSLRLILASILVTCEISCDPSNPSAGFTLGSTFMLRSRETPGHPDMMN